MLTSKLQLSLFLIFAYLCIDCNAQSISTFQQTYGSSNDQYSTSLVSLPDGGFILSGATGNLFIDNILLVRIDSLGKTIWAKTYYNLGGHAGFDNGISPSVDVSKAPNGNILVEAESGLGPNAYAFLFEIDLNGKVLWSNTYKQSAVNNNSIRSNIVINDPHGGFILAGTSDKYLYNAPLTVIKTNSAGSVMWAKTYTDTTQNSYPFATNYDIIASRGGGFLIGGTNQFDINGYNTDYQIVKINSNGKLLWSKNYGTSNNEYISSITELPDKSIYVFGSYIRPNATVKATRATIQKLDSTGTLLWSKQYYLGTSGSGIVLGRSVYDSSKKVFNALLLNDGNNNHISILRFDTSGSIIFTRAYNAGVSRSDQYYTSPHNFLQLPSKGFAFLNSSAAFPSRQFVNANLNCYFFIKTDSTVNTNGCNTDTTTTLAASYPVADRYYNILTENKLSVVADTGSFKKNIVLSDSIVCVPFVAWFGRKNTCSGYPTQFLDSSYYKATNWQWNFGDSSSGINSNTSALPNPVHTYAIAGTYKVKLIASNGVHKDSVIRTVTIYQTPTPFKFDTLICGGSTITIRASGGATYKWSPSKLVNNAASATPTTSPKKTTNFIVEAISAKGCITNDTVRVIVDNKPATPQIDYATVKTSSEIDVKFQKSDSSDVKRYEVFRSANGGTYSILDTINNLSNKDSFYFVKDSSVSTGINKYAYKVLAEDSCRTTGDTSTPHQTMVLAVKQLGCTQTLQLNWNPYIGWASVKRYEIFRSVNNGADSLILSAANNITTYNDTGLNHKNIYCYKLVAIDNVDSFLSQSNTTCKETFFPDTPQILSVSKISTSTTNGTVVIKWNSINKVNLAYNLLYFSRDGFNFSEIGGHFSPGVDSFTQTGLDTKDSDYKYYLVTIDSCGAQSVKSPISKTMTLVVNVGELLHKLNWTPYYGFKIQRYKIQRFEKGAFVTIDSVPGTDTSSKEFPAPCNYAIRYRIAAVGYDSGEMAWSDTMGRKAIDTIPSDPPVMLNATVLNGNSAKINFIGSDSLKTYEFVIQHSIDGNWSTTGKILFTHPGDSLQFIDNGINTVKNHICYTIITLDSCLNASESDTFCLINLRGKGVQMSDSIYWYPFVGYDLNKYSILTLGTSGIWDTLTTVNSNDTAYFNANLKCGQITTYKIAGKEKSGNQVTFSDSITLTPFDTIKPPTPQLYYAAVLPDQTVKLSWQWNPKSIVKYFEIWRGTNHSAPVLIDSVISDSAYIDKNANVRDSVYSYFVIAIDSCNTTNRSKPSQKDSLMQLKLYSLYCSPQVQVHWTPFTGLPNGVSSYEIRRSTDGINFTSIGSVGPSATMYIDTNVSIGKQYFYKTEAIDSKSGYISYSDTLSIVPRLIPLADSAQLVYATVLKSDETSGEIYIQWKRALKTDTNARGYYVYSINTANGKYTLLKNISNLNDTSYIEANVNTLQNAYKYYIVTYNVCDVGANSNIHKTVLLKVHNNNLEEQLTWTNYHGIPVKSYSVYKSKDGGSQFLVNNPGLDSAFSDSNVACNHNFTYQIQAVLANGEISFSDSVTVKSFDTISPVTKPIIVATVIKTGVNNGQILLVWNAASDHNPINYNIYRSNGGISWLLIRQQYMSTSLIDTELDTHSQSYYYKIQPVDSCGNLGAITIYHETIHLMAQAYNGYNQLSWTRYEGWKVKKYLVYKNGGLIDTVDNITFSFKDTAVICNVTYQYVVKAIDSLNDTIISASNIDISKTLNTIPQRVYIKAVSVSKPNKSVTITWTNSKSYDIKNYFIFRKSAIDGSMKFIDSTTNTSYIDSNQIITPPLGVGGDCYYVFARNHCGNQSDGSNQGCVIILNAQNQPGYNQLSWNGYQYWPDGVQSYNVYKNEDSSGWQLIGTTSSMQVNDFKDSKLGDSTIDFCYQVEAIENPGQYNQLSRSTVQCVHQNATVFIPNSFTPSDQNGLNDYFGPVGAHVKNYSMNIYNRWGEQVYNTTSGKPWDGSYRGQFAQQGVYIYLITVTDYNGKQSYFKGTITIFD